MKEETVQEPSFEHVPIVDTESIRELRQYAVLIARWLITHGMINSEVRIDSLSVTVLSPEVGMPFTSGEEAEIFLDAANHA